MPGFAVTVRKRSRRRRRRGFNSRTPNSQLPTPQLPTPQRTTPQGRKTVGSPHWTISATGCPGQPTSGEQTSSNLRERKVTARTRSGPRCSCKATFVPTPASIATRSNVRHLYPLPLRGTSPPHPIHGPRPDYTRGGGTGCGNATAITGAGAAPAATTGGGMAGRLGLAEREAFAPVTGKLRPGTLTVEGAPLMAWQI